MMNFSVEYRVNHVLNSIFLLTIVCLLKPEDIVYFMGIAIWLTVTLFDIAFNLQNVNILLFSRVNNKDYIIHSRTGKMKYLSDAHLLIHSRFFIYWITIKNKESSKRFYFLSQPKFKVNFAPFKYQGLKEFVVNNNNSRTY